MIGPISTDYLIWGGCYTMIDTGMLQVQIWKGTCHTFCWSNMNQCCYCTVYFLPRMYSETYFFVLFSCNTKPLVPRPPFSSNKFPINWEGSKERKKERKRERTTVTVGEQSLETLKLNESWRIRWGTARPKKNEEWLKQWERGEEEGEEEEAEIRIVKVKQRSRTAEGC